MTDFSNSEGMTTEQRIERIESLIAKLLSLASSHPMGKTVLKLLGL